MWSRLEEINGEYSKLNDKKIRELARSENNALARTEYIIRYFNSSYFSPFGDVATIKRYCDAELVKFPEHNFFNYVRAQLESDNEKKINYLLKAAKFTLPFHSIVSAEAAYEAGLFFFTKANNKSSTKSLAWLSKAIILHSSQACDDFCNDNFYHSKKFSPIAMSVVFLTTYLSGKKISTLAQSKLLTDNAPRNMPPFVQAYSYPNYTQSLHQSDSPIRRIAEWAVSIDPVGFIDYFTYCFIEKITSEEVYLNLMLFYLNSGYTDKYNLRQRAIDAIVKCNLQDRFVTQPQAVMSAQPYYPTLVPSAPPVDNPAGSYYYMYSMEPQMMPVAPQYMPQPVMSVASPVLQPVYTTALPAANQTVPATPVNTAHQEETYPGMYMARNWL